MYILQYFHSSFITVSPSHFQSFNIIEIVQKFKFSNEIKQASNITKSMYLRTKNSKIIITIKAIGKKCKFWISDIGPSKKL